MKNNIKIVTSKELNESLINKIIRLKSTHWKKSISSQKKWFNKKIFINDIHILIKIKNTLIGYVALRKRKYYFNNDKKNIKGILLFDTLIVRKNFRGNRYAEKLVKKTLEISKKSKKFMILSCKKNLLNFYTNFGWKKLKKENLKILDDKNLKNNVLIYKYNLNLKNKIFKKKINLYINK